MLTPAATEPTPNALRDDRLMRVHHCCGLALALSASLLNAAAAQEPAINSVSPAAVLPGQATTLTFQGANLAGAKGLWTSFGAQAVLSGTPENGTKADTVTYDVTAGSDIPVGIHSVRVWTDKGVSPLRYLLVDDLPSVAQAGNNTAPESAQVLTAPVAVDGAIGNLSLQYFKVTATEGQKLYRSPRPPDWFSARPHATAAGWEWS